MATALHRSSIRTDLPWAAAQPGNARPAAPGAGLPVAVVCVSVGPQDLPGLRSFLLSLAHSRAACGVPVARGALAVLILASPVTEALAAVGGMVADYPFPLRVEAPADAPGAARLAAEWAAALGAPDLPVLLADAAAPVAPRWAYETLSALRDGADIVSARSGFLERLLFGPGRPVALSGKARRAMEGYAGSRADVGWTGRFSPWRRPRHSGLLSVTH
ncbi:hypothetical protein [Roseomonas sp. KE2513]|uniref:hypothetical protein n=1 Tax=Roseomonas sp. KE2513 TaxID=2479202 RepID=UPI0018DF2A37|nr:hypothetical protein [Roseomonas sp. KE2513]